MKSIKAIFRRGQNAKLDGQNLPDNLSRTSSITNLDAEQKPAKGAKPRKSASRDRIDKIGEGKKNDKKGVTKNNNKLESGDSPYPSIDSLQGEEFLQLRRQLQEMAQEKSNLALQLGEQKGQLNILQKEIQSLKSFQEESNLQLEQLSEENTALRNRLRDVAHSPLSDNEKQQLLYETHHRHHSSAPASIATNLIDEGTGGDITACPTPDWDKHSSSNVSEVSVACLQDKINQMQETHYSTNEELQATLQELTDLQRQLTELQQENERLNEEKTLMFDSLCRQTERLNDSRSEVESLKQLLYREKDEAGQYESAIEREQKLLELLKSAQEEKQGMLLKLEQVNSDIQEARVGIIEKDERVTQLSERVRTLESTLDAKHAEHKLIDQDLAQAKDQCSGKQIEINRLTDLLDNARTKIIELEQDRALIDKSELDELLDNARKEKDSLESEVAHLKEQLAISKNEIEKLKEQVSILQEECKVTRNNARTKQNDLEYKCEKLISEKNNLNDQLLEFQEAVNELQMQSQCQLEDKRQLSAVLSETQRNLSEAERKNMIIDSELQELKKVREEEVEEWEKFQNDLLTSVRVANDFKTEAQQDLQRMILENKSLREKERLLRTEVEKLKGDENLKKEDSNKVVPKSKLAERQNSTDMENLLGLSKRSRDRPRRGKDSVDATSRKDDKNKEKKPPEPAAKPVKKLPEVAEKPVKKPPEVAAKPVKKREKPTARSKKNKTLSVEEELLMKSLNDWYENIDKNVPEEKLTEEQKVIKKLKTLYEDESLNSKPVAHKPKNQLAISKPLLDSVFLNPKLEEIVKDPNMPTIEEVENYDAFSENEAPEARGLPDIPGRSAGVRSVDLSKLNEQKKSSIFSRSKSCDDLYNLEEKHGTPILYRSAETEDLRKDVPLVHVTRESSILPSDSVSNPRYSDFAAVVDNRLRRENIEHTQDTTKLSRNSSVNFETLESILATLPKDISEDQLNSEQKFAVRLKKALDEAERKNTLKKVRKTRKQVVISTPTADSVEKNAKLRDILLNPQIQSVRRNSEVDDAAGPFFNDPLRQSKSYQDISFSFGVNPSNDNRSLDSTHSTLGDSYGFNKKNSVTETFSSTEFDNETNLSSPYDTNNLRTFKDGTVGNKFQFGQENPDQDLLYNETLNKKDQSNRLSGNSDQRSSLVHEARNFKVKSIEGDDAGKNHIATVITSEDYVLVLDDTRNTNQNGDVRPEPPKFNVKHLDEGDSGRSQTATVATPERQVAVSDHSRDRNRISYLPNKETRTRFKVELVDEDELDRSNFATVVTTEEHTAVLDYSYNEKHVPHLANRENRSHFKVEYVGKEKINRSQTATVVYLEEHLAILDDSQNDNRISKTATDDRQVFNVQAIEDVGKYNSITVSPAREYSTVLDNSFDSRDNPSSLTHDRLPVFVVKPVEDEIDRNRTTTVILPKEHAVVLSDSPQTPEIPTSAPPTFRVELQEDEVSRNNYATIIPSQEQVSVLSSPRSPNYNKPFIYRVESHKDEVDKSNYTTTILPEHHIAILDESQPDSLEDLTYNETLNKRLIHKQQNNEEIESENRYEKLSEIPDIIVGVTNIVPSKPEDSSQREIDESYTSDKRSDYEDDYLEAEDEYDEENLGYDYHAILKENRYGVETPLNIRLSYKDVVKEIKTKFPPDKEFDADESLAERDTFSDEESVAERDTFFDDFFGIKRKVERTEPDGETSSNANDIDDEMEEIFEKYLHTPVSKVITQIGSNKVDDLELQDPSRTVEIQKVDEEKVTSATNFAILASEDNGQSRENLGIILEENVIQERIEDKNDVPDEDTDRNRLVEENKDASHISEASGEEQDKITDKMLSHDLDKELVLTENKKQSQQIVESVNENISLISKIDDIPIPTEKVNIDDTDTNLSEEELNLLRALKNVRYSRPLSDFSDKDLRMIEELSARYLPEPKPRNAEITSHTVRESISSEHNETTMQSKVEIIGTIEIAEYQENDVTVSPPETEENDLQEKKDEIMSEYHHQKTDEMEQNTESNDSTINDNKFENVDPKPESKVIDVADGTDDISMVLETKDKLLEGSEAIMRIDTPRVVEHQQEEEPSIIEEQNTAKDDNNETLVHPPPVVIESEHKRERNKFHVDKLGNKHKVLKGSEKIIRIDKPRVVEHQQKEEPSIIEEEDTAKDDKENFVHPPPVVIESEQKQERNNLNVDKLSNKDKVLKGSEEIIKNDKPLVVEHQQKEEPSIIEEQDTAKDDNKENLVHPPPVVIESQQKQDRNKIHVDELGTSPLGQDFQTRKTVSYNRPRIKTVESKQDEDDLNKILARMATPSTSSRRKVKDIELRDGKPKVVLRNTNYEGVKSKLEFFSKQSTETTQQKRQSLNPQSGAIPDRRKVKSWAEQFEKRSLDTHSSYEPVYANLESLNVHRSSSVLSSKIDKKPLPVPRSRNLGGVSATSDDSSDTKDDGSVDGRKMSDCKIISENDIENLSQEHPGSDFSNVGKAKVPDIPVYSETSRAMPEGSLEVVENDENLKSGVLGINRSEKFLDMRDGSQENVAVKDELESLVTGAESSFSSIAVAGKFEELDITKHSDDMEEIITTDNESHLNLFHLETPSYDESYLSLFKSPEDKMYEDISGVKKPQKGYFNIAYLGEGSDSESCEEMTKNASVADTSKPKIIDFVPLDDGTKDVFKKDNMSDPNYDTLEREKTFQVLNTAASTGAVRKSISVTESKNVNSAAPSSSRMSFSAAKKVFESLLESNLDTNKEHENPKLRSRESVHERKSQIEVKASVTAVKKP